MPSRFNTGHRRLQRLVALLVALALLSAGCGESTEGNADIDTQSSDLVPTNPDEQSETSMAASSPLTAFFIDEGGLQAAMMNYIVLVEEEVQLCMAADGFEYIRQDRSVPQTVEAANRLTRREWTKQYGYGIATEVRSFDPRDSEDPNTAILMQMTDSERELWVGALTGGQAEVGPSGMDQRPLTEQGCVGQAFINTGGQGAFEGMQTLGTSLEDLETALLERREVVTAIDQWSRCLSERGYPEFGRLDEPEQYAREQVDDFEASVYAALPEITDEERAAWMRGEWGDEDPDFGAAGLPELQHEEIELALADLDCYETHVKAIYEPLRNDVEYALIDEHGDELSSVRELGS